MAATVELEVVTAPAKTQVAALNTEVRRVDQSLARFATQSTQATNRATAGFQRTGAAAAQAAQNVQTMAGGRSQQAIQQLGFLLNDMQQFSYGAAAGIRATSNNVQQLLPLLGAGAGLSFAITTILSLLAVFGPKLIEAFDGGKQAAAGMTDEVRKQRDAIEELLRSLDRLSGSVIFSRWKEFSNDLADVNEEIVRLQNLRAATRLAPDQTEMSMFGPVLKNGGRFFQFPGEERDPETGEQQFFTRLEVLEKIDQRLAELGEQQLNNQIALDGLNEKMLENRGAQLAKLQDELQTLKDENGTLAEIQAKEEEIAALERQMGSELKQQLKDREKAEKLLERQAQKAREAALAMQAWEARMLNEVLNEVIKEDPVAVVGDAEGAVRRTLGGPAEAVDLSARPVVDVIAEGVAREKEATRQLREEYEARQQMVQQYLGVAQQAFSTLGQFFQGQHQARMDEIAAQRNAELERIDAALQSDTLSQRERVRLLTERTQIEEKYRRQELEARRAQARRTKAIGIFEAIVNTASAVAEALPNIFLAAAVGTLGAAQVGIIASQPLPRFARGGVMQRTGMALVGEEGPEIVGLPAGARVHTARQTERMLAAPAIDYDRLGVAVANALRDRPPVAIMSTSQAARELDRFRAEEAAAGRA